MYKLRHSIWDACLSLKVKQGSLFTGYILYGTSMGVSGVAQVALFIVSAKWMEVSEFGLVGILLITLPLLSRALVLGADTGYAMRIWRVSNVEQSRLLSATVSAMLITVALLIFVGVVLSSIIPTWGRPLIILGILVAASRAIVDLFFITLRRSGRVLCVSFTQALRGGCVLAIPLTVFCLQSASAITYLVGLLFAELVTIVFLLPLILQTSRLSIYQPGWRDRVLSLLKIGAHAMPMMLAMLLLASGDRFVVGSVLGLSAVAVYTLGQKFAEYVVQTVFAPFVAALGPIAWQRAARDMVDSSRMLNRAAALLICAGGSVVGLVAVGMKEAISQGYGPEYADSTAVFLWVAFAVVAAQVAQIFTSYFSHTEKLIVPMVIYTSATAGMLMANYALAAEIGVVGVAAISAIIYTIVVALMVWFARRHGSALWGLRQHFVPLFVYATFLCLVGLVDTAEWNPSLAIPLKLLIWGGFVYVLFRISVEFQSAGVGLVQRIIVLF